MDPALATIVVACIVLVGGVLERRHSSRMKTLEEKNSAQHAVGLQRANENYTLLQSIDTRTIAMDTKIDEHGQRLTAVEVEITHLKPQKVVVESTPSGHTTAIVESPGHKESDVRAVGSPPGESAGARGSA